MSDYGKIRVWKEFGVGGRSVYLYYFPSQKSQAQNTGQPVWECKIGHTKEDVHQYVQKQLKKVRQIFDIADTEYPEIPLIFKTDNSKTLETQIHDILKVFDRKVNIEGQREWFFTNPNEVIQIYHFIVDFDIFY